MRRRPKWSTSLGRKTGAGPERRFLSRRLCAACRQMRPACACSLVSAISTVDYGSVCSARPRPCSRSPDLHWSFARSALACDRRHTSHVRAIGADGATPWANPRGEPTPRPRPWAAGRVTRVAVPPHGTRGPVAPRGRPSRAPARPEEERQHAMYQWPLPGGSGPLNPASRGSPTRS